MIAYDVVVLAGGTGRRLARSAPSDDKAMIDIGGRTLLQRVLAACKGAEQVVVVGPRRDASYASHVTWCREEPPGGGPVAALGAAWALTAAPVVVVLAVDHPFIDARAVSTLVDAATDHDGACGVDEFGRRQPLVAAYRRDAILVALAGISPHAGARVRDLVAGLDIVELRMGIGALDCDTPADVERARATAESLADREGR